MAVVKTPEGGWAIKSDYDNSKLPLLQSLPGQYWDKQARIRRFTVAPDTILLTVATLNRLGFEIPAEILDLATQVAQEIDAGAAAADDRSSDPRLYGFQKTGVRWLSRMPKGGLLGDDMGLGKTVQGLLAIPEKAPAMVVCPANVKGNWCNESKHWRPDLTPVVLEGEGSFRWPEPGELIIVNPDILPGEVKKNASKEIVVEGIPEGAPQGLIIIGDEVHYYKGRKSQRSARYKALNQIAMAKGGRSYGLTGTPLMNHPPELWQVLDCLGLAEYAFENFGKFCGLLGYNRSDRWEGASDRVKPEVSLYMDRVMLRREKMKVLPDLPSKRWKNVPVDLPVPKNLAEEMARIERGMENGTIPVLPNGLPAFEEMSRVRALLATYKIPAMVEVVEEFEQSETPLVVFSAHVNPIEVLAKRDGWKVIYGDTPAAMRTQIVAEFQAGKLRGVGLTIKAGSEGITLTRASNMLFVDLDWTPAKNTQAEDRIHRIGQKDGCFYQILVANHALDARMGEILCEKREMMDAVIKATENESLSKGATKIPEASVRVEVAKELVMDTCPMCDTKIPISKSGPNSKRPGVQYSRCTACDYFRWMDQQVPEVRTCETCKTKNVVKTSKAGRPFTVCRVCPDPRGGWDDQTGKAKGMFQWADHKDLPQEEKDGLTQDLRTLLGSCDGAQTKDDVGFNGHDVTPARRLNNKIDMGTMNASDWDYLKKMLVKYRKTQLGGR